MVEPFSTAILNTLLSGRSTLRNTTANLASTTQRTMNRITIRKSVPLGFFTPQPRTTTSKGKERENENDTARCRLDECMEWSGCIHRHSLWCPYKNRLMMFSELSFPGTRTPFGPSHLRRHKNRHPPLHSVRRAAVLPTRLSHHGGNKEQRRHASRCLARAEDVLPLPTSVAASSSSSGPVSEAERHALYAVASGKRRTDFNLEETWRIFELVSAPRLPPHIVLTLMDRFMFAADPLKGKEVRAMWANRVLNVLEALTPRTQAMNVDEQERLRLTACALVLGGDARDGTMYARVLSLGKVKKEDLGPLIEVFERAVQAIAREEGDQAVLEYIADQHDFLSSFLTMRTPEGWSQFTSFGSRLRKVVFAAVVEVDRPAYLLTQYEKWTNIQRRFIGNLLIEALCFFKMSTDALEVLYEMRRFHLYTPVGLQLALVRALTAEDLFGPAQKLFESIPETESPKYYLSTGLHLHSHSLNIDQAESFYQKLEIRRWLSPNDITMRIAVYTKQSQAHHREHGLTLFNTYFPQDPHDRTRHNSPRPMDFHVVLLAHTHTGDIDAASNVLEDMTQSGLSPNLFIYTTILHILAANNDLTGIHVVMDHMRNTGLRPDAAAFTVILSLLGNRRDILTAETVFLQALREGVVPNRHMLTSLMNAHVEVGSWQGAIRIFDYIQNFPMRRRIRPTMEVYTTLIKAYVLSGTPFHVVAKLVRKLEKSGFKADNRTFALLIQSACDAGRMDIALDLFQEMDRLSVAEKDRGLEINVYVMTILLSGYLRRGDQVSAKNMYDDMIARGIQPSAVSFSAIVRAYANEGSEESIKVADDFIKGLVKAREKAWKTPSYGRKEAVVQLYGPLLTAHSKNADTEQVERVFQDMVNAGGSPSLNTLSIVLDAYRRKFDVDAVQELWPQVLRLALAQRDTLPSSMQAPSHHPSFRGFILCTPFSMYIDALSAAGLHAKVAATWSQILSHGFTFDSHNWNHLCVALVRAGDVEKAFEILEKVLLVSEARAREYVFERNMQPSSPLFFLSGEEGQEQHGPSESAERNADRRAKDVRRAEKELERLDIYGESEAAKKDFAHPLHILHQISPSWGRWWPHKAVLTVLLMTLIRLESGALVNPIRPDDMPEPLLEDEPSLARETLKRIYQNYPATVRAVHKFEAKERRRLGADYDGTYNSG